MQDARIRQVTGRAIPLPADDIDTDRIIPARYLRCVTFDGLGPHAFEDDRAQDPQHPFNQAQYQGASILFAGRNFGCGSSREHAPQSLNKWGIRGIVAQSYAEIFFGNCQALGIPCFTVSAKDGAKLCQLIQANPKAEVVLDVVTGSIHVGDTLVQGHIPEGTRKTLVEGTWNATMVLLQAGDQIEKVANKLPYVVGF